VRVSDLFGVAGRALLEDLALDPVYRGRVNSLLRLIDAYGFEIAAVSTRLTAQLAREPGYQALLALPGVGPVLAGVFFAEIGDVHRFPTAAHLASWAGLTPRHRESDTTVHRGSITKMGCGGRGRGLRPTSTAWGGPDADCGWDRYSSPAVDVRLRGRGLTPDLGHAESSICWGSEMIRNHGPQELL
jgi:hypothetical protein